MRRNVWSEFGNMHKVDILNRTVEWEIECGIFDRAVKRHSEINAKEMGLESSSKGMGAPGGKDNVDVGTVS